MSIARGGCAPRRAESPPASGAVAAAGTAGATGPAGGAQPDRAARHASWPAPSRSSRVTIAAPRRSDGVSGGSGPPRGGAWPGANYWAVVSSTAGR